MKEFDDLYPDGLDDDPYNVKPETSGVVANLTEKDAIFGPLEL